MQLNQQFLEIAEKYKQDNEKFEVYSYVFKYVETDEEFYYYILYKKYQQGKGNMVLSSKRGLIDKQEAVKIAYFFLTHNGTAKAANHVINKNRKRSKEYVEELIELLLKNRHLLKPLQSSIDIVIDILTLQAKNTERINQIYQDLLELDQRIHTGTKVLTEKLWQKGRNLIKDYDALVYSEVKEVINNIPEAEKIMSYLNERSHFSFIDGFKARKILRKMERLYGAEAKQDLQNSLEGFEKDFQGNFFTKTRGELSTDEYVQFIHQMAEYEYKKNLLEICRNP
ncbi:hypothetical protein B4065_3729 [Caldibacillus thermoamylovorans]|uniref:Uncharacterized protein n=1 Tax=Caldibacillus thermoamylovorans TaxID=35841 RepID=A0ABD4A4Q5_9BACI|nr:hypothetical protein [Caldibacillus thermoamylovorans]KIO58591.1 hypothetical protein B4065_3729 [Caldibacillus thermoamylovorans]KIO62357.1 hypothetical protein B4166_3360 [Caldibacillus thermoamylovorans]KIO71882.1 hypothetical protein B4167_3285 [Caldibacillus thermoamylovorans]